MFLNFRDIIKDESGQTTTEYLLILGFAAVIVILFKEKFKDVFEGIIGKVGTKLDGAVDEILGG